MNQAGQNTTCRPLTARQQLAVVEILSSRSLEEARKRVRAAKGTFYGWLRDPTFQQELSRQKQALVHQAVNRLRFGIGQATEKLLALLDNGRPSVQLRSAQTILDYGFKAVEMEDIESRLAAIEAKLLPNSSPR